MAFVQDNLDEKKTPTTGAASRRQLCSNGTNSSNIPLNASFGNLSISVYYCFYLVVQEEHYQINVLGSKFSTCEKVH